MTIRLKPNETRVQLVKEGTFTNGKAVIIGKYPASLPYVNIDDADGNLVVSIDDKDMDRLCRLWGKANRGGA